MMYDHDRVAEALLEGTEKLIAKRLEPILKRLRKLEKKTKNKSR